MAIIFDRIEKIIEVEAPETEVTIQELLNAIREYEDELSSIDLPQIGYASGKEELGGGVTVGITLKLVDWKVKFEERTEWTVCNISGGNLVCYDTNTSSYVTPIEPSAYVTATLTASSSATTADLDAIQYSSYQNSVWIDINSGNAGTVYPIGTREYPVDNITDAVAIANAKGFSTLQILSDMTIDSGTILTGFELIGKSHVDTLIVLQDTVSCASITLRNANVGGVLDGNTIIYDCLIGDLNYFNGHIHHSGLYGTITLGGSADAVIENCFTVDQDYPPEVDMGGSGQSLAMPNYSGLITISNLTSSSEEVGIGINHGQITLDSTITAGTIIVSGIGMLVDNTTGTASVNNDALLCKDEIAGEVWDTLIASHIETGSTGEALSDAGAAGNPWSATISGNTDAGTFGELVGKKLLTLAKWLGLR